MTTTLVNEVNNKYELSVMQLQQFTTWHTHQLIKIQGVELPIKGHKTKAVQIVKYLLFTFQKTWENLVVIVRLSIVGKVIPLSHSHPIYELNGTKRLSINEWRQMGIEDIFISIANFIVTKQLPSISMCSFRTT